MTKIKPLSIEELLSALTETMTPEDILSADILSDLSVQITKERLRRKMSQTQFANFLDVSQSMVSKWESEDYNFTIQALCKIAVKLGWEFRASFINQYITASRDKKIDSPKAQFTQRGNDNVIYMSRFTAKEN